MNILKSSLSLDTEVRKELERRLGEWRTVAKKSGVSYSWISKFVNGHIPNPGHTTLVRLAKFLMKTP